MGRIYDARTNEQIGIVMDDGSVFLGDKIDYGNIYGKVVRGDLFGYGATHYVYKTGSTTYENIVGCVDADGNVYRGQGCDYDQCVGSIHDRLDGHNAGFILERYYDPSKELAYASLENSHVDGAAFLLLIEDASPLPRPTNKSVRVKTTYKSETDFLMPYLVGMPLLGLVLGFVVFFFMSLLFSKEFYWFDAFCGILFCEGFHAASSAASNIAFTPKGIIAKTLLKSYRIGIYGSYLVYASMILVILGNMVL